MRENPISGHLPSGCSRDKKTAGFSLVDLPPVQRTRPKPKPLTRAQWQDIKIRRRQAEKKQLEGIESQDIFKKCIEGKLARAGAADWCSEHAEAWWHNFQRCGEETFYLMCGICGDGKECSYQCSLKWCPRCNWRISMTRRGILERMTRGAVQVKHVVLTQRNFEQLTKEKIMASRQALLKIRKSKILGKVTGGCASMEFTNEGRGWHMHWHMLLQSPWIIAADLAARWAECVGQEFAIVKVKDVSEIAYVQELCKYVVEGSELARWEPAKILQFVTALRGTRLFATFGTFKSMWQHAKLLQSQDKPDQQPCSCGCNETVFGNDREHCKHIARKKGLS
jgi:hypothetical protein